MYQAILLGSVLLVTLYALKYKCTSKLNMPPLVPYKYPIIGHTFKYYSSDNEKFLKQCRKEYGDIFRLYVWGDTITIIGKENFHEVLSKDDSFSFEDGTEKMLPLSSIVTHLKGRTVDFTKKILNAHLLYELNFHSELMQKTLNLATQKCIGNCDEPKVIRDVHYVTTKVVSSSIANMFFGEEESQSEEIVNTFAEFTTDVTKILKIPPVLDFIYPGLQLFIIRIVLRLGFYNPAIKHQKVLIKHLKKQICKRLQEKEKYGDSWKRPEDFLQNIIDEKSFDPNNINYAKIADHTCLFVFASIHTTSRGCTNVLMDLASRPEYMQELYEEQVKVHKEAGENGILPFEAFNNMKKLDSIIRESLRLSEHNASLWHAATKDYTFSNGLQVPKGHMVYLYTDDIYHDESLQGPNPKSFEPFRHVDTNTSASKIGKNYMVFGGGKHACPGRHFAVNEIKFFMHNLIIKYNFRTESGKIEDPIRIGPIKRPSRAGIIFERRNS